MKKSLSLVLVLLLFVVLGCSLSSLTEKDEDVPTPTSDSTKTDSDTTSDADKPDSDSTTSSGTADVSMESFNKLKLGMSYNDAKAILGADGTETSSSKVGSNETKSYQWKGKGSASIRATFRNDELNRRSQFAITDYDGTADINQAKFNDVKTDMSYDEVKKILGSDGELVSEYKYGTTSSASYTWKGPKGANIRATFTNDKLSNKYQSRLN